MKLKGVATMSIDVLSVGDIVTDAFIKLEDDQARATKDTKGRWLTMPFGVKIPYNHVEVLEAVFGLFPQPCRLP